MLLRKRHRPSSVQTYYLPQTISKEAGSERSNGRTLLHLAAASEDTSTIITLLEAKADVSVGDNEDDRPLHLAVQFDHSSSSIVPSSVISVSQYLIVKPVAVARSVHQEEMLPYYGSFVPRSELC